MPILVTQGPEMPSPPVPPRKRWTRDQCGPLEQSGLFEQERLELVDGELISKMGENRPHSNAFRLMLIWLQKAFGDQFVDPEVPIDVSAGDNPSNEPVPDLIVLKRDANTFVSSNPQPQDLNLVIEIADGSLRFDLTVKAALYARAEIVEYWVLDVTGRRLFCHRLPALGRYTSVVIYQEQELIGPLAAPKAVLSPSQVLPV